MSIKIDPSYLRYIHDGLNSGSIHTENASSLPDGLTGLYESSFLGELNVKESQQLLKRFAYFSLLNKEVSCQFVAIALGESESEIVDFISTYSKWFNSSQAGKYSIYHERLRTYILSCISQNEFEEINNRIISLSQAALANRSNDEWEYYALEYFSNHLFLSSFLNEKFISVFKEYAYNNGFWLRQTEVSKGYTWSKETIRQLMLLLIKFRPDEIPQCCLYFLDLNLQEQNDYPRIINLIVNEDFKIGMDLLNTFGGRSLEQGKRRFLLATQIIRLVLKSDVVKEAKLKKIDVLLKFIDDEISEEKYLFNWSEYLPAGYILETSLEIFKIGGNPIVFFYKSSDIDFANSAYWLTDPMFLKFIDEIIDKLKLQEIVRFEIRIKFAEFLFENNYDQNIIIRILRKCLNNCMAINEKIGSKLLINRMVDLFLKLNHFDEVLNSGYFVTEEFLELLYIAVSIFSLQNGPLDKSNLQFDKFLLRDSEHIQFAEEIERAIFLTDFEDGFNEIFNRDYFINLDIKERCRFLAYCFIVTIKKDSKRSAYYFWQKFLTEIKNNETLNKLKEERNFTEISSSHVIIKDFIDLLFNHHMYDKVIDLITAINNSQDVEILLYVVEKIYARNKDYNSIDILFLLEQKIAYLKKEQSDEKKLIQSLIMAINEDFVGAINSLRLIEKNKNKDYLIKHLLKTSPQTSFLIEKYLNFYFQIPSENAKIQEQDILTLKFLEDYKSTDLGKTTVLKLKMHITDKLSQSKNLFYFQRSKEDYLSAIASAFIERKMFKEAKLIAQYISDSVTLDTILFELDRELMKTDPSYNENNLLKNLKNQYAHWQIFQYLSLLNFNRQNYDKVNYFIEKINSPNYKIQAYFDLTKKQNLGQEDIQREYCVLALKYLQEVKDKFEKIKLLKKNATSILRYEGIETLLNELKIIKNLRERLMVYLEIAEKCKNVEEFKFGQMLVKRVLKSVENLTSLNEQREINCRLVNCFYLVGLKKSAFEMAEKIKNELIVQSNSEDSSEYFLQVSIALLKIKKSKSAIEINRYITNKESKLKLYRFIGTYYSGSVKKIISSEFGSLLRSEDAIYELIKCKLSKMKTTEMTDEQISFVYFLQKDIQLIYSLTLSWYLSQLFINNKEFDDENYFIQNLNLQWAIDIKNSFSEN